MRNVKLVVSGVALLAFAACGPDMLESECAEAAPAYIEVDGIIAATGEPGTQPVEPSVEEPPRYIEPDAVGASGKSGCAEVTPKYIVADGPVEASGEEPPPHYIVVFSENGERVR